MTLVSPTFLAFFWSTNMKKPQLVYFFLYSTNFSWLLTFRKQSLLKSSLSFNFMKCEGLGRVMVYRSWQYGSSTARSVQKNWELIFLSTVRRKLGYVVNFILRLDGLKETQPSPILKRIGTAMKRPDFDWFELLVLSFVQARLCLLEK